MLKKIQIAANMLYRCNVGLKKYPNHIPSKYSFLKSWRNFGLWRIIHESRASVSCAELAITNVTQKKYRAGGELRKLTWDRAKLRLFKCVHVTIWQELSTANCVAEQLPNRGSLFERPLLENCDRERVWNPNRVQFLDVWTELRGSTGICWFATLQSYDSRERWQNVCINFNLLLHWSVVSSTCNQTGISNWQKRKEEEEKSILK